MTTEFRKGLPSKAQVKAHEANGGLWEDRGPHASVSGCYFHLDSDVITTDDGATPMTGLFWDDDSYRPLKADRTPLDWESLTITLPAGTKLGADPDLQALYAIVDGASGPAPMPVDVEAEWKRRTGPGYHTKGDGSWQLRCRAGNLQAINHRGTTWAEDEPSYGATLRQMRDILDTVAAARKGSKAQPEPTPVANQDWWVDALNQSASAAKATFQAQRKHIATLETQIKDLQAQLAAANERAEKAEAKVKALEGVGQAKAGEGRFSNLEID